MRLDHSVYPDCTPPETLDTIEDKADYLHRVLSAFDFGIPPELETLNLFANWKEVFNQFPMPHSPAYHAFRQFYGWERVEGRDNFNELNYQKLDREEGREDLCEGLV